MFRTHGWSRSLGVGSLLALVGLLVPSAPVQSQNPAASPGLYISVPSPLTTEAGSRIRTRVEAALARTDQRPAVVVFDFNPKGTDVASPDFGPNYDLAAFITRMNTTSVAYVHQKVSGHTVLPVLACTQIVMGPGGSIGEVARKADDLRPLEQNAYKDIVGQQHPAFVALVRKMFDPGVQLRKGTKAGVDHFVDLRDAAQFGKEKVRVTDTAPLPFAPDRAVGNFNATQLREVGLSNRTVASEQEVLDTYGLTSAAKRDDTFGGRAPVGFTYVLRGKVDGGMKEAVERMARQAIAQNATVLFLQIECAGGDLQAARDLAQALIEIQHPESGGDALRVVAFIPDRAPDTAAVIALGCAEIVMSRRTDAAPDSGEEKPREATIGDFEPYLAKNKGESPATLIASLRPVAEANGHPPVLVDGMLDRDVQIVRVHKKGNQNVRRLVTEAEFQADKDRGDQAEWQLMGQVKPKGQLLNLTASRAQEYGLARAVVDTRDANAVYALYGLDPGKVQAATPAWLDRFAAFLKLPAVTVLLVVVAFIGLFLEMKVPGTAFPGIIAALCFILVFWAHTQFSGQVAVLAGLLFILGLVLILIEVFILPGLGVAGITGVLLILGSLALVTVDQTPDTWEGALAFAGRMATYLFAMIGGLVLAFVLARYLPNIPYANRLLLPPPTERAAGEPEIADLPGAELAASLLGAVGTAQTVLRPAGTVRFGEQFVDVVTEGGFVPAGARVQVVEVEGTRIVVKEV